MTRRDLLKFAGAGSALAFVSLPSRGAESSPKDLITPSAPPAPKPNSAHYRFRIGDFEAIAFSGGIWDLANPHGLFAPQATPEQFRESLDGECLPDNKLSLHFNMLLVRTGKENILIDAGFGDSQPDPFKLTANLAEVGLKPSDISQVYLSHAHSDHMGGLLNDAGKQVFSKAEHFCSAEEKAFWTSAKPDFSTSAMDADSQKGMIERGRKNFESLPFTTLKADSRTPEGLSAILAPGHTPGHLNFLFESKGEKLHHIVDLAHHYAVMLPHPDWTVAFDWNPNMAAATRKDVFARLAAEKTPVFGYHMPFPALGRLKSQGSGYRWVNRTWEPGL